jgi:pilus biogenesis lipoprotein CpaD
MTRSRNLSPARRLFTRRRSRLSTTLLALAAIIVAGCAEYESVEPPHKDYTNIPVEWVAMAQEIAFGANSAVVDAGEAARLDAFLDRVDARLTDQVALDPGTVAAPELARARAEAVTQQLHRRLPGVQVRLLAESSGGTPQLIVGRYVVVPIECAGWFSPEQRTHVYSNPENTTDPNFGCATAKLLAAMVSDPGELAQGRNLGPADAAGPAAAIQKYRVMESPHPYAIGHNSRTVPAIE